MTSESKSDQIWKQFRSFFDMPKIVSEDDRLSEYLYKNDEIDLIAVFSNDGETILSRQTGIFFDLDPAVKYMEEILKQGDDLEPYTLIVEANQVLLVESQSIIDNVTGKVNGILMGAHLINGNLSLVDRIQTEIQSKGVTFFVNDTVLASTEEDPNDIILNARKAERNQDSIIIVNDRFFSFDAILGYETINITNDQTRINVAINFEDDVIKELRNQFVVLIVQLSAGLVIMMILVYFFLDQAISKVLAGIFDFSSSVKDGDFSTRYEKTNIEEIDELGHHIQDMAVSMIESHKILKEEIEVRIQVERNLKELNANLEMIVAKRTRNVEEKNQELTESLDELQKVKTRVESMNSELELSLSQLQHTQDQLIESEKMAALANIIVGVSHELNTPLGVCLTTSTYSLELIKELKATMIKEDSEMHMVEQVDELKESTNLYIRNLNKLCNIVDNFKNITETQTDEKKSKMMYLKNVIEHALRQIGSAVVRKDIEYEVVCGDQIIVESYPGSLSHVIAHLIVNAIEHGIGQKEDGKVTVLVDQKETETVIDVKDNGRGIPALQVPRIFEPFFYD